MKFYLIESTGEIIATSDNKDFLGGVSGLKLLTANTVDAAKEKHVPVVTADGNKVTVSVGSVEHPMTNEHHIKCVILETNVGFTYRELNYTGSPKAEFLLAEGDKAVAVYEFCNLHGLWKTQL